MWFFYYLMMPPINLFDHKKSPKKVFKNYNQSCVIFCIFLMPHHNLKNAVCDLWLEKFRVLSKQCLIHFYTFHVSLESFLTLKIRAFLWRKKNRNCQCCYWVCHKKKKERKGKHDDEDDNDDGWRGWETFLEFFMRLKMKVKVEVKSMM